MTRVFKGSTNTETHCDTSIDSMAHTTLDHRCTSHWLKSVESIVCFVTKDISSEPPYWHWQVFHFRLKKLFDVAHNLSSSCKLLLFSLSLDLLSSSFRMKIVLLSFLFLGYDGSINTIFINVCWINWWELRQKFGSIAWQTWLSKA